MSNCVVVGISLVSSLGQTVDETFDNIFEGKSGIRPIKRISTDGCYSNLGAEIDEVTITNSASGIGYASVGKTLKYEKDYNPEYMLDTDWNRKDHKYYHILGKALDDAIDDAQLRRKDIKFNDIIINATCSGDTDIATFRFNNRSAYSKEHHIKSDFNSTIFNALEPTTIEFDSDRFLTISTACSSSTVALSYASDIIRYNLARRVIVMSADILSDIHLAGFLALHAIDENGCHPFNGPNGLTLGDGAAAIVLESEELADERKVRKYCYITGSSVGMEANHITAPDETGESQKRVMTHALADANLDVTNLDFIYTHGTGTPKNDMAESLAMEHLIGNNKNENGHPYIGSSKSAIGHTLGASGIINAVLATKMFSRETILPTVNFTNSPINSNLNFARSEPIITTPHNIMVNSFAFGGNDASIILSDKPGREVHLRNGDGIEILSYNIYTNKYNDLDKPFDSNENLNPHPVLPAAKDFLNSGIDTNNLRKMDLYSRIKSMSGIAALKESGISYNNRSDFGILGVSTYGTPTAMDITDCKAIFTKGNNWGNATNFPNSVQNAGDGWLSINTGIKGYGSTILISESEMIPMVCYIRYLFDTLRVNNLLVSYCDLVDDSFICLSLVLGRKSKSLETTFQKDFDTMCLNGNMSFLHFMDKLRGFEWL